MIYTGNNKSVLNGNSGLGYLNYNRFEYLAIISSDDSSIFQVMSFNTEEELNEYCSHFDDGLNYISKYKAFKLD